MTKKWNNQGRYTKSFFKPLKEGWVKPPEPQRKKEHIFYDLKKFTKISENTRKINVNKTGLLYSVLVNIDQPKKVMNNQC